MYYNPLTKEEEFHELVKEIESQSAYKRQPPLEKKYMSVPEMGRLLGLKKTDRYWLVHKNFFKTEVILGKMRVELESFEKWYANQVKYHKVTGEEPGLELKKSSYSPRDIAEMLQISENLVYEKMKRPEWSLFWWTIGNDTPKKHLINGIEVRNGTEMPRTGRKFVTL